MSKFGSMFVNTRKLAGVIIALTVLLAGVSLTGRTAPALPSEADSLMNKAQAALLRGDTGVALELAKKAVQSAPKNPQCYTSGGESMEHKGTQAGRRDYDKAIEIEPRGAELYQLRGFERFKLGDITGSIDDFRQIPVRRAKTGP